MGVVSTPPLPPPPPPPPPLPLLLLVPLLLLFAPGSPGRLILIKDTSTPPFLCGTNGSTSADSFTSCTERESNACTAVRRIYDFDDGRVAELVHREIWLAGWIAAGVFRTRDNHGIMSCPASVKQKSYPDCSVNANNTFANLPGFVVQHIRDCSSTTISCKYWHSFIIQIMNIAIPTYT